MEQRQIGSLAVPVVGLGCNQFARKIDYESAKGVIDAALEAGLNFLDTSDRYGNGDHPYSGRGQSEAFIGQALEGRRDQVVLATKFGNQIGEDPTHRGGGRHWVPMALAASLERLRTDYIDLYQIHRPDSDTPIEETLEVLTELIEEGSIREIGCCNFSREQLEAALEASERHGYARFESVQNEYSLLCREPESDGVLALCRERGVGLMPYFPLASGLLTGKYLQAVPDDSRLALFAPNRPHLGLNDENTARVAGLAAFAEEQGHTLLELAFSWLVSNPSVSTVIAGATSPAQVQSNAASGGWSLTAEENARVNEILSP